MLKNEWNLNRNWCVGYEEHMVIYFRVLGTWKGQSEKNHPKNGNLLQSPRNLGIWKGQSEKNHLKKYKKKKKKKF